MTMASGPSSLVAGMASMTRSSSADSLASDIDLNGDQLELNMGDNGNNNIDETSSNALSNTPTGSTSGSVSPNYNIMQGDHQRDQQQQHQHLQQQQQQELNLQNSAKNKKLFPQKLWDLINDERYSFCLRWSDDGQLVYLNRDEFEDSYLKKSENQFHTQKAISFVRQMNMYGFRKVDDCYYENDNFKRGCEHLLRNMVRKHPNKSLHGGIELPTHLLYPHQSRGQQQNSAPAAPSTLTDCRQRLSLPFNNNMRSSSVKGYSINQQQHFAESDRSNEDSLSSFGDYCYSIGSNNPGELQAMPFDLIKMSNENIPQNLITGDHTRQYQMKQQQQQQQQQQQMQTNLYAQLNSNLLDQYRLENFGTNLGVDGTTNVGGTSKINNLTPFYQNSNDLSSMNRATMMNSLQSGAPESSVADMNNSNVRAFYDLFSSLNANLYPSAVPPQQALSTTNSNHDFERLMNFHQLYQHILTTTAQANGTLPVSTTSSTPLKAPTSGDKSPSKTTSDSLAINYSSPFGEKSRNSSPRSILLKSKTPHSSPTSVRSVPKPTNEFLDNKPIALAKSSCGGQDLVIRQNITDHHQTIPSIQQRETNLNRSFKRSVNSILDSNNNNSPKDRDSPNKRTKLENNFSKELDVDKVVTASYARGLVTRIALARDPKMDDDVIEEASKYTERFVETLFETAQVIARHSHGSSSDLSHTTNVNAAGISATNHETISITDNEEGRASVINVNNLSSALKLVPSKMSKILW